jgi:hypothetical protein
MGFYGQAEAAAQRIVRLFEDTNSLPAPLAQVFIRRKDGTHCRKWSWGNQVLVVLHGYTDARGFRQWEQVGRRVKKGEKAFYILGPIPKKLRDEEAGEERTIIVGFKGLPVFGLEQTEGRPLQTADPEVEKWVDSLPLLDVAKRWGLSVGAVDGDWADFLGRYRKGKRIDLATKNLSTWCHELVHAADDRNGSLTEKGQHWRSETVAELGGATLLEVLGFSHDADLGGCFGYIRAYAEREKIAVTEACMKVLDRTCQAVALILDTAGQMKPDSSATAFQGV